MLVPLRKHHLTPALLSNSACWQSRLTRPWASIKAMYLAHMLRVEDTRAVPQGRSSGRQ